MDHGPNALLPSLRRLLRTPVVGLALLAGCETAGQRSADDVLLGGTPAAPRPIPPPGRPASAVAGAPGTATTPLPPLPPPGPSSSLASLATGSNPTPENDRRLHLTGVTPVPGAGVGRGGATLHGPLPVDEPGPRITPVGATGATAGMTPAAGTTQDLYQQVMEKLRARGMTWMRLETTGESGWWKFSCTIADRQNPGIEQRYEATGNGEGGLAAMRAVLEKIDHPQP